MDDIVQRIKERVDLVDIVSRYVKLTKAGKSYKGLSPFKKEKTPSFFVSPDKQLYYCFASGKGGDVFTFIQEMERVDFRGALEILAKEAGIPLKPLSPAEVSRKERWYALLEAATTWFEERLNENQRALSYLAQRGVDAATVRRFRIGYAPAQRTLLIAHLQSKGFTKEEMLATGVAKEGEGGEVVAQLRSRIVFPLADPAGRVVGFSGRRFPDDVPGPKYLNTPETPLFKKGELLYPWHLAKEAIRHHDCAIVVEGQMDVVNVHRVGWPIAVAVSGTGFTEHHATLLARAARRILFALDADEAGFRSLVRSARLMLERGVDVRVIILPDGKDPADVASADPQQWRTAVRGAEPLIPYVARTIHQAGGNWPGALSEMLIPLLGSMPSAVARSFAAQQAAEALNIPAAALLEDVAQWRAREAKGWEPATQSSAMRHQPQRSRREQLERFLAHTLRYASQPVREALQLILPDDVQERMLAAYPEEEAARIAVTMREEEQDFLVLAKEAGYEVLWLATKDALAAATKALRAAEAEGKEEEVTHRLQELNALRERLRRIEDEWGALRS